MLAEVVCTVIDLPIVKEQRWTTFGTPGVDISYKKLHVLSCNHVTAAYFLYVPLHRGAFVLGEV